MRTLLFSIAAIVGCGGTEAVDDSLAPFESGSRLRAVVQDGGDGAVALMGWRDTELDVACQFMPAEDGVSRCLPVQGAGILFLDMDCTERATSWGGGCSEIPAFLHAGLPGAGTCASGFRVGGFEVGEAVEVDTLWTLEADGTCREQPIGEGTQTVYRVTAMPPERFAGGTPRQVDVGGGLGVEVLETEDGASVLGGLFRTGDDRACQAFDLSPGVTVCVAGVLAYGFADTHTDAECSNADVVSAPGGEGCPEPEIAVVYHPDPDDQCAVLDGTLAHIGAELDPGDLYGGRTADECQPVAGDTGREYFSIGAPLEDDPPPVTKGWLGSGRVRFGYVATADGALLTPSYGEWRDEQEDRLCFAYPTTSDGLRCLPDFGSIDDSQSYFDDDACSGDRLVVTWPSPCEPDRPPPPIAVHFTTEGCESVIDEVFELGEPHEGPAWVSYGDGNCNPADSAGQQFYRLGATRALGDFAPIEEVQE